MALTESANETAFSTKYPDPVASLLPLGKVDCSHDPDNWPNYPEQFGLTSAHIPALIQMATDDALHNLYEPDPAVYGPVHAWRALGQLKATEAVEPLLGLVEMDTDWVSEEIPPAIALIGPVAIPALQTTLADTNNREYTRIFTIDALSDIARRHPEERLRCLVIVTHQLAKLEPKWPTLNGFLISALVDEKYRDAVPLIEQAFQAGIVDTTVNGTLDDVLVDIGAKEATPEYLAEKERREAAARLKFQHHMQSFQAERQRQQETARIQQQLAKTIKAKRKQQKQARKNNRRK
jgi:hypothetical protein